MMQSLHVMISLRKTSIDERIHCKFLTLSISGIEENTGRACGNCPSEREVERGTGTMDAGCHELLNEISDTQ